MENFYYITTRAPSRQFFTAIITKPVDGQSAHYLAPDLSNALAIVTVSDSGQVTVHKLDKEALKAVDFDTSTDYLAKDAKDMSDEYDNGASGDLAHHMAQDALFVEGELITFFMDLDAVE